LVISATKTKTQTAPKTWNNGINGWILWRDQNSDSSFLQGPKIYYVMFLPTELSLRKLIYIIIKAKLVTLYRRGLVFK